MFTNRIVSIIIIVLCIAVAVLGFFIMHSAGQKTDDSSLVPPTNLSTESSTDSEYIPANTETAAAVTVPDDNTITASPAPVSTVVVEHLKTPSNVRALYMSSWVASTPSMRDRVVKLVDDTNINAIVIDIKDDTGRVSFLLDNDTVNKTGSPTDRIKNVRGLINDLHKKNIYVIGRIATFQDPYLTHQYPEWAIHRVSDGAIWKDKKGLSFLDPTKKPVWEYMVALAEASYETGFDEINFDYIRFPSDGNIQDISYPTTGNLTRADHIENFFSYLNNRLRVEKDIPTSADLFGMTTTNHDDLGIGQVLERAIPYFDHISPMIYPSHYPKNFHGFDNPAAHPGAVVTIAMQGGIAKAATLNKGPEVFRPWIQDFNMGAKYGITEVRAQIDALDKLGIHSYMVWDPGNSYTVGAYDKE